MPEEPKYYDGCKLLSMRDINGKKPEIYMIETNRTGGKTTFFGRLCVNKFLKEKSKFCLLYRYSYELDDIADKFYKDISSLFFPGTVMTAKNRGKGKYKELFLNDVPCGYGIALNDPDYIKKNSHFFSDVDRMLLDEFQSESNNYCTDEIGRLLSIHTSIARGHGKQTRYVPLYMCGNPVSILNPYYVQMGITTRLRDDTKFLKGPGFVLERGYIDSAARAQQESGFNQAFANHNYVTYAAQAVYLKDNAAFIERPAGQSRYLATLRYNGTDYAIREFADEGIIYCDDRPDKTYPGRISLTTEDHQINYVMLRRSDMFLSQMRWYFERGCFRFKDLQCKDVILRALSY